MYLSDSTFRVVLDSTPLVSVDLLVSNLAGQILLGQRINRPAQHNWFVPGGRIIKNETIEQAFRRLTEQELGQTQLFEDAKFQGAFDHIYSDSIYGIKPSTHYVALAFRLQLIETPSLPKIQHSSYQWFTVNQLLEHPDVHENTKLYFSKDCI